MACIHLRRLFQLCQDEQLRLSGSDLIHLVCQQCGVQEVCPSALVGDIEANAESESKVVACVSPPPSSAAAGSGKPT